MVTFIDSPAQIIMAPFESALCFKCISLCEQVLLKIDHFLVSFFLSLSGVACEDFVQHLCQIENKIGSIFPTMILNPMIMVSNKKVLDFVL